MYIEKLALKHNGECGYLIKRDNEEMGSFILSEQKQGVKKLRQLQVSGDVSKAGVLYVFELIQSYAKEEGIRELQVESHSDDLNRLLTHQQFVCKDEQRSLWTYDVINN